MQSISAGAPCHIYVVTQTVTELKLDVVCWTTGREIRNEYDEVTGHQDPVPWVIVDGDVWSFNTILADLGRFEFVSAELRYGKA